MALVRIFWGFFYSFCFGCYASRIVSEWSISVVLELFMLAFQFNNLRQLNEVKEENSRLFSVSSF